ncbi:GNAT family N-acetyltransferase [Microbacterium sp. NPDC055903]
MPSFSPIDLFLEDGLRIDAIRTGDAPTLLDAFMDADLRRWLPLPRPYTAEMAEDWCGPLSHERATSGRGFVAAVRVDGAFVASIDAKRVDWAARSLELSYWTAPAHRGRGIMTRAVRAVALQVISAQGFERVELRIAPENTASLRVADRAGFTREGVARNAGYTDSGRIDLVIHSLIPADIA